MHSGVKNEAGPSMNFNARNAGGERRGGDYSRGRQQPNTLTICDFMDQEVKKKLNIRDQDPPARRGRRRGGQNHRKQLENQDKPQGSRQTHIHDLNDDCLLHIFSFLPIVARVRTLRVCKRWNKLCSSTWRFTKEINLKEDVWGVHYSKSKVIINQHAFHQFLKLCGNFVTHVDLTPDEIGRIPRIRIKSCVEILAIINETCPNLQSINIAKPAAPWAVQYLREHFPKLTSIGIVVSTFVLKYEWEVQYFFTSRKNLKYIKLINSNISSTCLMYGTFENLEGLHVQYCTFEDANSILNIIEKSKKLHTLFFAFNYSKKEWENAFMLALANLTTLRKLDLGMEDNLYKKIDTDFVYHLTNLQELSLYGGTVANDEVVKKLSCKCRNIRKLRFENSSYLTDESMSHIANLPRLECLHFDQLSSFIGQNLNKLSQIKYLHCSDCPVIINEGFVNLIASSENIRYINIRKCHLISEEVIEKADSVASEQLHVLLDNKSLRSELVEHRHSLNKVGNRIVKKFDRTCFYCTMNPSEHCTDCYHKVQEILC